MSGGAAGTHARADANEQAGDDKERPGRRDDHLWRSAEDDEVGQRTKKEAGDKGDVVTEPLTAMPLMPAMRPLSNMRRLADKPISAPPAIGAK